jgi:hypothetical protein
VVVAGGLGTGDLVIFSLWRCPRGDVVIQILTTMKQSKFLSARAHPISINLGSYQAIRVIDVCDSELSRATHLVKWVWRRSREREGVCEGPA